MSDGTGEEVTFEEILDRMGALADELERADPAISGPVLELLDYFQAWHHEGILRLATAIPPDVLLAAREDPVVAHLLDAYLSEDEDGAPTEVIDDALEEIRPYVHSHGGEMEVVQVDGGVVTLRLMGSCQGCPSSTLTLTQGVERILRERWPGFRQLRVEGEDLPKPPGPQLLQIQSLKRE